jgi:hypothetical protein
MNWIDLKYIGALAPRLSMFAKKDNDVWNMRCPICGDSRKSKTKARGYILGSSGGYVYTCHNCNVSMPFGRFLETIDPSAYQDYLRERYVEKAKTYDTDRIVQPPADISKFITPKFIKYTALSDLKKISQLEIGHPARRYIVKRQIPNKYHAKLFFAPKFKAWTNTLKPDKFDLTKRDEPRLVIPFVDQKGNLFGYQGRAFFDIEPRYITIILDEEKPRVYGLDAVNLSERVYVTEGPIDSMFLHNCLAMGGAHLDKTAIQIGLKPDNTTIVYDNEPRNRDIVNAIEKVIDLGYSVCIWPASLQYKDVNDMVLAGMTPHHIQQLIDQHTYRDLLAKMMLTQWKKI